MSSAALRQQRVLRHRDVPAIPGGGHFDYCPRLRGEHGENYPGVQQILHGGTGGVLRLPASPGTLAVFAASTPCTGSPRSAGRAADQLGADLWRAPGMRLTELTQKLFYGRTA